MLESFSGRGINLRPSRLRCWMWLSISVQFSSVQSFSHVQLFVTPWTAACQAFLYITNCQSLPKPMSIELVIPSSHLILCCPLLLLPSIPPSIRVFSNESALRIRWPNIGVSASTSVLPVNTQDWSPLGCTGWISLQSKGLSFLFPRNEDKDRGPFWHRRHQSAWPSQIWGHFWDQLGGKLSHLR